MDCAVRVAGILESEPPVRRFFRYSQLPDEMAFHTLVQNRLGSQGGSNLRHIEWCGSASHPSVLDSTVLETLRGSPALFARKFEASNTALIDRIEQLRHESKSGTHLDHD